MPRPEEVGQHVPAPADAPRGTAAEAERATDAVPISRPAVPRPPVQAEPQPQPQEPQPPTAEAPVLQNDLNRGRDNFLFGPSERPNEPITFGAPFGPGPMFVPQPAESERDFLMRVASSIETSPAATEGARNLAERIRQGE